MGRDAAHHDQILHALLKRCSDIGIKLNSTPDKLQINCSEISLHGHQFSIDGIKADPQKIQAIQDLPCPSDVHDVRRICGMVQYLSRFLPHLAEVCTPLRELTHKDAPWKWTKTHEDAFITMKHLVSTSPVLAHYEPSAPLVIQTDASSHGLGAVMLQHGKPICYASRAMTPTEQRYAQIEKELLSIVFGLRKFDQYTYGRHVIVQNDHRPLQQIASKPLHCIPKRLQAMRMVLGRYDFSLQYHPGKMMFLPDTLSRAHSTNSQAAHDSEFDVNALTMLPVSKNRLEEIRQATLKDSVLQELVVYIRNGWPDVQHITGDVRQYYSLRDKLTVQDDIVLFGERLVIPQSMRQEIKTKLHTSHLGQESMLRRARELVFWPKMNPEIRQMAMQCQACQDLQPRQVKEPLMPHPKGEYPFQKVGCDIVDVHGRSYLVTVDYLSSFWEVDYLPTTTSSSIISKLKAHFARFGIPETLVSDNGPNLVSQEFENFLQKWGIEHLTSSPGYSQSNGKAESAVKAAQSMLKKCKRSGDDPYLAMLEIRNTPIEKINLSPSQMLLQRRTNSIMPAAAARLMPSITKPAKELLERSEKQKEKYDKGKTSLATLTPGTHVKFDMKRSKTHPIWRHGIILRRHSAPRSYIITDPDGID